MNGTLSRHKPSGPRHPSTRVHVQVTSRDFRHELRQDATAGLSAHPRELSPRWFYDDLGSRLFNKITDLPEYYLTRREKEILTARASEIAKLTNAELLVELGSGTSEKTHLLLKAMLASGRLKCFAPFDVSERTLRSAARQIATRYPAIRVNAVVADFERDLDLIPSGATKLIAFLGSTIGNLRPSARVDFYSRLAARMGPDDALLLGTDLVKDIRRLNAAYNDSRGVTAEFNRNILRVLNRELGANFEPSNFEHVARYDYEREWMEMLLRSKCEQTVHSSDLGITLRFARDEEMRTEISAKFRRRGVQAELARAGLSLRHWWTDPHRDYAMSLSVKRSRRSA
jgi:L-histidine N-alpha-methyltransferase